MNQPLAVVGKIVKVDPIEKADRLESATVVCGHAGKWMGVVPKGDFSIGDLCNVFLQDAVLPGGREEWSFMEKRHWRVSMAKFRGAPSECLILKTIIPGEVGDDIAEILGVAKYEKPEPVTLGGDAAGDFPWFIQKTDEPNFQTVPEMVAELVGKQSYATVKYDGTSCTAYRHLGKFGVCSRNLERKEGNNTYWEMARKYNLESIGDDLALQFEIVGPGIQGNPLGLKKTEIRVFSLWNCTDRHFCNLLSLMAQCVIMKLPMVEVIKQWDSFPSYTDDELRGLAEGFYPNGKPREGIVIRESRGGRPISFKVINLDY